METAAAAAVAAAAAAVLLDSHFSLILNIDSSKITVSLLLLGYQELSNYLFWKNDKLSQKAIYHSTFNLVAILSTANDLL